jgi:ABC-type Fe3+-hydroxamate transport system substrate-binding protein
MPGDHLGWKRQLREVAAFLGEEAEAERWISAFECKAAAARANFQPLFSRTTVLTLRLYHGQFFAHCNLGIQEVLYRSLGLRSSYPQKAAPFNLPLALEQLDASSADHILLLVCKEAKTLEGQSDFS